jgi:hypothetical protein
MILRLSKSVIMQLRGYQRRPDHWRCIKTLLCASIFAIAFSAKASDGGYRGTIVDELPYVVQMDDGRLLDVELDSGYECWSSGDRVMLTTESGGGYMYNEDNRTQVDVFPYNPANIGD